MNESTNVHKSTLAAWGSLLCSITLLLGAIGCGNDSSPTASRYAEPVTAGDMDTSGAVELSVAPETAPRSESTPAIDESFADIPMESAVSSEFSRGAEADDSVVAGSAPADAAAAKSTRERRDTSEEEFTPKNDRQSGLLTAGSFDDVANFSDFLSFLRRNPHQVNLCRLPVSAASRQTVIRVRDDQGRPLGNVRCRIQKPNSNHCLLDRRTGTDGRVMLLTNAAHHGPQAQPLTLQLLNDDGAVVAEDVKLAGGRWDITLSQSQFQLPTQLDLALVVDTTGSMGDELEYLKAEIDSIVASVNGMFPGIDQRYSLVTYRDNGDEYVCRTFDFTGSLSDFRRHLDSHSAGGGGDFPEAMDVALDAAGQLSWRQGNTARVLFLVGDAPPHSNKLASAVATVDKLGRQGVRVFPVGASGVEKTAEVIMRSASLLTMGQYLFLTDHSGVGNAHATPDVPEFAVERLDRLMIRMIASELAGKRLGPQEVIAIEHGESYTWTPAPCCLEPVRTVRAECTIIPPSSASLLPAGISFGDLMAWLARNVITVAVMSIVAVFVFDHLSLVGFTLQNHSDMSKDD